MDGLLCTLCADGMEWSESKTDAVSLVQFLYHDESDSLIASADVPTTMSGSVWIAGPGRCRLPNRHTSLRYCKKPNVNCVNNMRMVILKKYVTY